MKLVANIYDDNGRSYVPEVTAGFDFESLLVDDPIMREAVGAMVVKALNDLFQDALARAAREGKHPDPPVGNASKASFGF